MTKDLVILGSTGSIGRQTLDVAQYLPIRIRALAAGTNVERMAQQCRQFQPDLAVMATEEAAQKLGKSQPAVANKLRLLRLPEELRMRIEKNGLTERHARALLTLEEPSAREEALDYVAADGDEELFQRLRALRKRLAGERGVPPYLIFNDATLRAMVRRKPRDREALLQVPGVGTTKLERYGDAFLEEIARG